MTFEEIMRNITFGLTGEPDHDSEIHYCVMMVKKIYDVNL